MKRQLDLRSTTYIHVLDVTRPITAVRHRATWLQIQYQLSREIPARISQFVVQRRQRFHGLTDKCEVK